MNNVIYPAAFAQFRISPQVSYAGTNNLPRQTMSQNPAVSRVQQEKPENSHKVRNFFLKAAAVVGAGIAAVYGVKKYQVMNVENLTKTFKDVFMRDDITPEMAKQMKARYLEIEKIKDPKEYAKALFEEAKKNYGFEKHPIKLVFEDDMKLKECAGFCRPDNSAISITSTGLEHREHLLNTMHHEFKHAKQRAIMGAKDPVQLVELDYRMYNSRIAELTAAGIDPFTDPIIKRGNFAKDIFTDLVSKGDCKIVDKKVFIDGKEMNLSHIREVIAEAAKKSPEKIAEIQKKTSGFVNIDKCDKAYIDKLLNAWKNYPKLDNVDDINEFVKYYTNFMEVDARNAGNRINKFVKGNAFDKSVMEDIFCMKIFEMGQKSPKPSK